VSTIDELILYQWEGGGVVLIEGLSARTVKSILAKLRFGYKQEAMSLNLPSSNFQLLPTIPYDAIAMNIELL